MKDLPIDLFDLNAIISSNTDKSIPLIILAENQNQAWFENTEERIQNQLVAKYQRSILKDGEYLIIHDQQGNLEQVIVVINPQTVHFALSNYAHRLPIATYALKIVQPELFPTNLTRMLAFGFALGTYEFNYFKDSNKKYPKLVLTDLDLINSLQKEVHAIFLARDLINSPPNALTPVTLSKIAEKIAQKYNAHFSEIIGEDLIHENFPLIYHVGKASSVAPRLIEITYGKQYSAKLSIIGKGVCFDSGGLDIKPSSGMRNMKKDMAGAAYALALAEWIMSAHLPIQLQILLPCVDNLIAGNAFKPGDIYSSRNGKSIEIENTDAEGRLIMADALSYASEQHPDLLIDFSTLTGAARIALGTELPAVFSNENSFIAQLLEKGLAIEDPLWQMPLFQDYQYMLQSNIADLCSASKTPYGGAISAALFLENFIPASQKWLHFDVMAWNIRKRPGRPEGGEAMGLRATYYALQEYFKRL